MSEGEIRQQVVADMRRRLPVGVDVYEIIGLRDVEIPNESPVVEVRVPRLRRATTATVVVKTGKKVWATMTVTINLSGQPMAPVLRRDLPRQSVISEDDLEMKATDYDKLLTARAPEGGPGGEGALAAWPRRHHAAADLGEDPRHQAGREIMLVAAGSGVRVAQRPRPGGWPRGRLDPRPAHQRRRVLRAEVVSTNEVRSPSEVRDEPPQAPLARRLLLVWLGGLRRQ